MSTSISNKSRFVEHKDVMGLILSNYVYGILNGELLDIRHFTC